MTPKIQSRSAGGEEDFWKVRSLLVETLPLTPPDFNWDLRRWDGSYFHDAVPGWKGGDASRIRLWENEEGRLLAVAHQEGSCDLCLQLHPAFRELEGEMLDWAEGVLPGPDPQGPGRRLLVFTYEYDRQRQRLLESRGYEKLEAGGVMRRQYLAERNLPEVIVPEGYILRSTREGDEDNQRVADLFNSAFGRDIHSAAEYATFTALSPSYRRDLDLVAEAPDGVLAAMAALVYDETRRSGLFEPVCTHPEHRQKGLARMLMVEGMRRIQAMGARDVFVATGDQEPANQLYEAMGFSETHKGHYWKKGFPA